MNPTYTPPQGNTPQGQQQFQQSVSLNAAAQNGAPNPPPTSMGMNPQQVAQGYMGAQQGVVALNTPEQRQQTLNDTTNLAGQQTNYDQLAQQLAKFDTGVLQPQFQGTNPGMPSDLPNNPYVTFGNVSYATPGSTSQPITGPMYNANPSYALTAQANSGNNIADLMSALNSTMSTGLQQGKDIYGGKLSSASTILKGWSDLMNMVQQDQQNKADLAYKYSALGKSNSASSKTALETQANKILGMLGNHTITDWGAAWRNLQDYAQRNGIDVNPSEIDDLLAGHYDPSDPTGSKGSTYGWAVPGAFESSLFNQTQLKADANAQSKLNNQPPNILQMLGILPGGSSSPDTSGGGGGWQ